MAKAPVNTAAQRVRKKVRKNVVFYREIYKKSNNMSR